MRTGVLLLALALVLGAPLSTAQLTRSSLVMSMDPPSEPFGQGLEVQVAHGVTAFTGDIGQYQNTNGVPITYTVTHAPAWAVVVVSPSSDIISLSQPTAGATVHGARPFTVTISLDPSFEGDATDLVEIFVEQGPVTGGTPSSAKVSVPVTVRQGHEECTLADEAHLAALAVEAADAYNAHQQQAASEPEEVTVQGAATPVVTPWFALGGFALVGAGVGLALRRRMR